MHFLPGLRRRREKLDARVEDARERAEHARAEADRSRQRAETVRENVVMPLQRAAAHNQFSEMLRASLTRQDGREQA